EDLRRRGVAVPGGVGRVGELAGQEPAVFLGQFARLAHHARSALGGRGQDDLGAIGAHELAALDREGLGHGGDEAVAARGADHGEGHAGVARGRLDHGVAGLEQAARFGVEDDGERQAVLDRAAGIEGFDLGVQGDARRRHAVEAHDGRAADGVEDALVDHGRRPVLGEGTCRAGPDGQISPERPGAPPAADRCGGPLGTRAAHPGPIESPDSAPRTVPMPARAMPPRRPLLACCAALVALVLAGCGEEGAAGGPAGAPAVVVTTATLAMQPFHDRIRALGTVQARESVEVTAKVSEVVDRVHFESGDDVAAGAPLVTLSGQQQQAALAAARATYDEAERMLRRQQELADRQLVARATLDAQRATRDSARAQVRQIEANLADRVVRAPFAGVLGVRQVSPGALITPGTVIATLDDLSSVYVDFPVPEAQLAHVRVG